MTNYKIWIIALHRHIGVFKFTLDFTDIVDFVINLNACNLRHLTGLYKLELVLSLRGNHGAKAPNRQILTRACREHVLCILKELALMAESSCVVFACAFGEIK